jgi:S1-C subfamily serine protease
MPCTRRALLSLGAAAWALPAWADLPAVIAATKTSVLPVGTYSPTGSPRFAFRGTGFVVGDGSLVATNFHVLPQAGEIEGGGVMVVLASRSESSLRRATVVATDRAHDLALLKIEGAPMSPLPLDAPGQAREGQSIALLGFPIGSTLGFAPVTHRGIVASITTAALPAATSQSLDPRAIVRLREGNYELLQLDATAYPGNSGGPVVDVDTGKVIGIVNMVLVKAGRESALTNPTGISYAVPVRRLHELIASIR